MMLYNNYGYTYILFLYFSETVGKRVAKGIVTITKLTPNEECVQDSNIATDNTHTHSANNTTNCAVNSETNKTTDIIQEEPKSKRQKITDTVI